MSIIEIKNLRKTYRVFQKKEGLLAAVTGLFKREYRDIEAVTGIDLTVEQGEFVAFLGPNGAGKTTTLKLLSGVINPTSGSCTVMGHTPWLRENSYRRRFALVMGQKNQLWWDLPAQESFRLHQHIYQIDKRQFDATIDELTDLLEIRDLLKQPVRELSLGERMKMELTAALLHSPDVLFLDEPTIGLDVVAQHNIQRFLKHYQQKRKITILLTSHYMKDVAALCKRLVIVAGGRIEYDGSVADIVDQFSSHRIVTLQIAERQLIDGQGTGQGIDQIAEALSCFGKVLDVTAPKVRIQIARNEVSSVLGQILAQHTIEDLVVEDLPLEDVIAEVFAQVKKTQADAKRDAQQLDSLSASRP